MQNAKIQFTTIIILLFIIISGGYGIISLLNCKANKANYGERSLSYYEQCTNNLKGKKTIYCNSIKKNSIK